MNRPAKRVTRGLLFSVIFCCVATLAGAAEKSPQPVQVTIGTILATNQNAEFDQKLDRRKAQLKVLKYKGYRLLKEESQTLAWQADGTFEIPGGRSLIVTPQEHQKGRITLKVRWLGGEKPIVDTTVKLENKGNFLLGGGPPHEGGVLVLSISAAVQ